MEFWQPNEEGKAQEKPWITLLRQEYLPRFQEALATLDQPHTDDEMRTISRQLFSLARAIRMRLGTPNDAPPDLVDEIEALFHRAGDALFVCGTHIEKVVYHASTLHERADVIEKDRERE